MGKNTLTPFTHYFHEKPEIMNSCVSIVLFLVNEEKPARRSLGAGRDRRKKSR
jgi:hypothetical protein